PAPRRRAGAPPCDMRAPLSGTTGRPFIISSDPWPCPALLLLLWPCPLPKPRQPSDDPPVFVGLLLTTAPPCDMRPLPSGTTGRPLFSTGRPLFSGGRGPAMDLVPPPALSWPRLNLSWPCPPALSKPPTLPLCACTTLPTSAA